MAASKTKEVKVIGGNPDDDLRQQDLLVASLQSALHYGAEHLERVPMLLKRVWNEGAWRKRRPMVGEELIEFRAFIEFITAPLPMGLGTTLEHLQELCTKDEEALDIFDHITQRPGGRPEKTGYNIPSISRPEGTSRQKALRRLRKDRPDLHAKVISKELSAYRAMIEAGFWREATPLEKMRIAWDKASPDERAQFRKWIEEQ